MLIKIMRELIKKVDKTIAEIGLPARSILTIINCAEPA